MSTTKKTTNQYNQAGMNAYNAFQPQLQSILGGYASNPFGNPFYQLNLSSNMAQAGRSVGNMNQNALSQFNMTGMGGAPNGALTSLKAQLGRYGSGVYANAFQNAASNAFTNQMGALNTMAGYRPLQTGQTQQTSGLGTWLPQVAGMAIAGAAAPFTGGASLMAMPGLLGGMGSANDNSFGTAVGGNGGQGQLNFGGMLPSGNAMNMTTSGMPGIPLTGAGGGQIS
jgi:hypothetical protein